MTDAVAEAQAAAKAAADAEQQAPASGEQEQAPVDPVDPAPASAPADPAPEQPKVDPSKDVVAQVGALVTEAGLKPEEVAKIVSENNGDLTPALFQSLVEKHGEGLTAIIADNLKNFNTDAVEKANENDNAVFDRVAKAFEGVTEQSGEESWKELSAWAKDNIPNEERAEINKLLQAGGLSAEFAVDHLVKKFQSDSSYSQSASLETADGVADSAGLAMVDKAEYDRELRKLLNEGHDYNTSKDIAQLRRRREKAIRRGY